MIINPEPNDGSSSEALPTLLQGPFITVIAANIVALLMFAASPHAGEYPVAALGIAVFLLVQLLLPACRPVGEAPLCPGTIAQAFFWVQLVLVPLLIGFYDIRPGTLPYIPSGWAIDLALCLRVLAYLAFSIAYQFGTLKAQSGSTDQQSAPVRSPVIPLLIVFIALGILGQYLAYGSLAGFVEFASSPVQQREREALPTTLAGAASTFLRPFLGFALVLIWSQWLSRRVRPWRGLAYTAGTALLVLLLLVANFSYNRGSLVAPVLAVAAAYSVRVRRISFMVLGIGATILLFVALAFGWYRSTNLEITDLATTDFSETWSGDQVSEFFEIYASGPQMTAYLVEERGDGSLYLGRTLVCSVLSPVPVIGKTFREESGVTILNMLIYHDPEICDQNLAYDAELYINFQIPGVLVGYALLGWLVRYCQGRFHQAYEAIENYVWLMLALWLVFPGSLQVISQMCVYFFWPVYGYLTFTRIRRSDFAEAVRSQQEVSKDIHCEGAF